jgi:hypothetical protein
MEKKNVYAGTGISRDDDPYKAGKESVEMAIEKAGKAPDFGFVFCSGGKYGNNDKRIKKLVEWAHDAFIAANKKCKWIGCTTAGEISNMGFSSKGVVAACLASNYLKFSVASGNNIHKNPTKKGMSLAQNALKNLATDKYLDPYIHFTALKNKKPNEIIKMIPYTLIVLTTGVSRTLPPAESEFLDGIKQAVGARVPIIGGSAADDGIMRKNYVFNDGKVVEDGAVITAMFSDLKLGFGVDHGYKATGKVAFVSKVSKDGHTLLKLDGKPAIDVVASWLGVPKEELSKKIKLPTGAEIAAINVIAQKNPLAVTEKLGHFALRVPTWVTKEGGIVFAPRINENTSIYLMQGTKKDVLSSAKVVVESSFKEYNIKNPAFGIFFDCSLRWFILKEDAGKEVNLLKNGLKQAPFIGFYTYGELGAYKGETASLCNQTLASLIISNEIYAGD